MPFKELVSFDNQFYSNIFTGQKFNNSYLSAEAVRYRQVLMLQF